MRSDLHLSAPSPLFLEQEAVGAGVLPLKGWFSTYSCGKTVCVPPWDGFACHPNIFSIGIYLKLMFIAFSLFITLRWQTVCHSCSGLWKAYSRFIESITVMPFSLDRRPAFMKLESLLCRLQSYAKQQHRASQFNNFCHQRGHTAQRMTVLLLLLKIVGRFVLHCNSCSSLCIVPVKRNICRGLLPPCEMFGWILLAQQSELYFKYCWLNLALTGQPLPELLLSMCWAGAPPQFQTSSPPAEEQDKSQWTAVYGKVFRVLLHYRSLGQGGIL